MNDTFDELARSMAQSVTRRAALKKFGFGLASIVLATLGLANKAEAKPRPGPCICDAQYFGCRPNQTKCIQNCAYRCS